PTPIASQRNSPRLDSDATQVDRKMSALTAATTIQASCLDFGRSLKNRIAPSAVRIGVKQVTVQITEQGAKRVLHNISPETATSEPDIRKTIARSILLILRTSSRLFQSIGKNRIAATVRRIAVPSKT